MKRNFPGMNPSPAAARLAAALGLALAALVPAACGKADAPGGAASAKSDKSAKPAGRLNVYMYSEYIDPEQVKQFEAQTGLETRIDVYESTEEMLAKLQQGGGDAVYDVVVVSDHAIPGLARQKLIRPLDAAKIPNRANVTPRFLDAPYDPGAVHSLPYQWGTMGVLHRKDKTPGIKASWGALMDPAQRSGPFALINSMRDMFAVALKFQGKSVNSRDAAAVRAAGDAILEAKRDARCLGFEGGVGGKNKVLAGEAVAAVVYNGDAVRAMDEDAGLGFLLPEEGSIIWVDAMTIPARAPNPEGAHKFIDFILDAKQGAALSNFNRYATPNQASLPLVAPADRSNPAIYPPEEMMAKLEYLEDLGADTPLYDEVWTTVKSR